MNDNKKIESVAEGIKELLRDSAFVAMSWGATSFKSILYNSMPGLNFTVNGFLFKGDVTVALNEGADLYEVYCLDAGGNVVKFCNGVYYDELVDRIDGFVEKDASDEEYSRKCKGWLAENGVLFTVTGDNVSKRADNAKTPVSISTDQK